MYHYWCTIKNLQSLNKINPSYIVISNPTSDHINKIKYIEQNFKNKLVLVEKPLCVYKQNLGFKLFTFFGYTC